MKTTLSTPAQKQPRPLPRLKAGEPVAAYGMPTDGAALKPRMLATDRKAIERALSILGAYLRTPGAALDTPEAVRQYLLLQLGGEPVERFCALYLDSQHRGIAFEYHASGSLAQTAVYPREIVEAAIRHRATAVVLAHNHPSGSTRPSRNDELLTQALRSALALVDVRVLDHVVVGGNQALSMAEMGLA